MTGLPDDPGQSRLFPFRGGVCAIIPQQKAWKLTYVGGFDLPSLRSLRLSDGSACTGLGLSSTLTYAISGQAATSATTTSGRATASGSATATSGSATASASAATSGSAATSATRGEATSLWGAGAAGLSQMMARPLGLVAEQDGVRRLLQNRPTGCARSGWLRSL
jgi:hypothetical protein